MDQLKKKFELNGPLTREQIDFYDTYGFLHFTQVLNAGEVSKVRKSIDEIHEHIISNNITSTHGIPIKFNSDDMKSAIVHRLPFGHTFSPYLNELLHREVFGYLLNLIKDYELR